MKTGVVAAALLVCLGAAAPAALAQKPCSMDSFAGTYAFSERGSSAIFDPSSQPYPFHWAGAYAPFVTVGEVTMKPGGVGEGFYWIRVGSFNGGADPIPVEITVSEVNADCTGKFHYDVNVTGSPTTIEERFILFDNGREFRTIPTSTTLPTVVWIGEGHRIAKPGEPLDICGPQTARGNYVWAYENLVQFDPSTPIFSDTLLLNLNVTMSGDYTGMLYEKLGPTGNIVLPASGTITVNKDCLFAATLNLTIQDTPVSIDIRGVYYDEGKEAFGLAVSTGGTEYSYGQGKRVGP